MSHPFFRFFLAFGVAFATLITLTLIPSLYMMIEDLKRFGRFLSHPWGRTAMGVA